MSSNLKVNTILPSTGTTVTVSGIASVTNNISVGNSVTASSFHGNLTGNTGNFTDSVGIGSVSPTGMIEVQKNGVPAIIANYNNSKHIQMGAGSNGAGFHLTTGNFFTVNHQPFTDRGTDNNLSEKLRITSGGMVGIAHHVEGQIAKELTIRPANSGGIRYVRPGETSGSPNTHLDLTTTTSGSAFPTGEAYTVKYKTYNCDQIFETYEGGGTGGNISFRTRSSSVESVRINKDGYVTKLNQPSFLVAPANDGQTANGYVTYTTVMHNTGTHYSTSTGRFTAPVTGYYTFGANYVGAAGCVNVFVRFYINGATNQRGQHYSGGSSGAWASNTPYMSCDLSGTHTLLQAGDYVNLHLSASGATQGQSAYMRFYGYLVH